MHGLLDCGISWFLQKDRLKSLPYMLASQGYDVWVGNNRGTRYSSKNSDRQNYWQYNFDHFVEFDQPTIINSILNQSQAKKIIYIGHSQGSTQFLLGLGIHQQLKQKIACFIGMGTVISLQNIKNHSLLYWASLLKGTKILKFLGFKTFLMLPKWLTLFTAILVYSYQIYADYFIKIVNSFCGTPVLHKIDKEILGVIISHQPGGASIPNLQQWIQFYQSGNIQKYDYGENKNILIYGTQKPPLYKLDHLKHLQFPCYVFRGQIDAVMCQQDHSKLQKLFSQKLKTIIIQDYAHLDYIWSKNAHKDIYQQIIQFANLV